MSRKSTVTTMAGRSSGRTMCRKDLPGAGAASIRAASNGFCGHHLQGRQ